MLGVTIRFDSYLDAEEHLIRVTEASIAIRVRVRFRVRLIFRALVRVNDLG
jgi:hypothetical protein